MHKNAARRVLSNRQLHVRFESVEKLVEAARTRESGEIPITQIEAADFYVRTICEPGQRIEMIDYVRVGRLGTRRQTSEQTLQNRFVVHAQPEANSVCAERHAVRPTQAVEFRHSS